MTNGHYDLLKGLGQADVDRTLALGSRMVLSSGDELFRLGADAECVYLISHGQISLTLPMQVRDRRGTYWWKSGPRGRLWDGPR